MEGTTRIFNKDKDVWMIRPNPRIRKKEEGEMKKLSQAHRVESRFNKKINQPTEKPCKKTCPCKNHTFAPHK